MRGQGAGASSARLAYCRCVARAAGTKCVSDLHLHHAAMLRSGRVLSAARSPRVDMFGGWWAWVRALMHKCVVPLLRWDSAGTLRCVFSTYSIRRVYTHLKC